MQTTMGMIKPEAFSLINEIKKRIYSAGLNIESTLVKRLNNKEFEGDPLEK